MATKAGGKTKRSGSKAGANRRTKPQSRVSVTGREAVGLAMPVTTTQSILLQQVSFLYPTYPGTKVHALTLLARLKDLIDKRDDKDFLLSYGATYNAKTKLPDVGLISEIMQAYVDSVNRELLSYPGHRFLTSTALGNLGTVGEFVVLFCRAASVKVPHGEPK